MYVRQVKVKYPTNGQMTCLDLVKTLLYPPETLGMNMKPRRIRAEIPPVL